MQIKTGLLVLLGLTCTQTTAQECVDTNINDNGDELTDAYGDSCADYNGNEGWCGNYDTQDFVSN